MKQKAKSSYLSALFGALQTVLFFSEGGNHDVL